MSEAEAQSNIQTLVKGEVEKETLQLEDGRLLFLYRDIKNQSGPAGKKGANK